MGEIIATASQKGGVGKTTTAVNLSASLAIYDKKVLIVDIDPQGSVGDSFGLNKYNIDAGMREVVLEGFPIVDAILETKLKGFDLVPTNIWDESEEVLFTNKLSNTDLLRNIINPIKNDYDYLIIDCPPSLGAITINAIVAADSLIIPIQCEFYALKALGRFLKMTRQVSHEFNPDLIYRGFLLTMLDETDKRTNEIVNELRRSLKDLVFETFIPRRPEINEAPVHSVPVALMDLSSVGAQSYLELAQEILK
jgi:chromosome partitioning protein